MSLNKLYVFLTFLFSSTFLFANCPDGTDVCLSIDGNNLNYDSTADIAGFQFGHDGCLTMLMLRRRCNFCRFYSFRKGSTVLAFSFTGSVVPAGTGTLVELVGTPTESCLSAFIFSDAAGDALEVNFSVEPVLGCTDSEACNFDASANTDDGSCTYPEENFDCDGNCAIETDCNGVCGGDSC